MDVEASLLKILLTTKWGILILIMNDREPNKETITPSRSMTVSGIPAVPVALSRRVGRYSEFRQAVFLDWHPKQHRMLISTRFGNSAQVHQVRFPGGDRRQLTFFEDTVRDATYHRTSEGQVLLNMDTGGDEFAQNYMLDRGTGDVQLLTDGTSKNSSGIWSHTGDRIAYSVHRRSSSESLLHVQNLVLDEAVWSVTCAGGGWFPISWAPDDCALLVLEYRSITDSDLWIFDIASCSRICITSALSGQRSFGGAHYARDGRFVYLTTDYHREFQTLAKLDIETQSLSYLTDDVKWDVTEFDVSEDGRWIAYIANEDGCGRLHVLDVAGQSELALDALPVGNMSSVRWHADSTLLAFSVVSANSPNDVYSIDISSRRVHRWTFSEMGGLQASTLREPELVRWPSFDGRMISGYLYRPPDKFTGPRPVMIVIHGGPESQFRPTYLGRSNYILQELGVNLFYPNVRGSSGYGKEYLELDNGYRREDSYKDIHSLLDWISTSDSLDSDRVVVTGGSYGGHMALAIATQANDRVAGTIDVVGMSNLVTFLENTEDYRRDLRRAEYGDERVPEMRAYLESIAPLNHAHKITKPLFIVQGKNDPRVPYTEALQMADRARESGAPVWFLMADDEGHGFIKKQNVDFQFYATILFLEAYLLESSPMP